MKDLEYLLRDGESFITEMDLAALRERTDFVPFSPMNDERNQAIAETHGLEARELIVRDAAQRLYVGDRYYRVQRVASSARLLMNGLIENPNSLLPMVTYARVIGNVGHSTVKDINNRFDSPPVVSTEKRDGRTFLHLAHDLQLKRGDGVMPTPLVPIRITEKPLIVHEEQTKPTNSQLERATDSSPIFDNLELAASNTPDRFAKMVNAELVNYRTELTLDKMNSTRSLSKRVEPNRIVFFGLQRAEINDQPYDTGPLAIRVMHKLMERYLDGWVEVADLRIFGNYREEAALQQLLHRLYVTGVTLVEGQTSIQRIMLKPALFSYEQ